VNKLLSFHHADTVSVQPQQPLEAKLDFGDEDCNLLMRVPGHEWERVLFISRDGNCVLENVATSSSLSALLKLTEYGEIEVA
jgi:hypothetical protein